MPKPQAAPMKHVFLIDGSGFIFRAYFGLPPMTRPDGTPVGAVYGFTTMLMKLVEETDADHIAVIFDRARATFRNEIYADYKANRDDPPDDLIPQFELVREATRAMGLGMADLEGFEADDLIATYARQAVEAGAEVTIVSSDKDLMQLVSDRVTMFDAMKNKTIGPDQVVEKFGVGPDRVVDVQALAGDSSDNVPGVQGIGIKTAAELINTFGNLDGVLENAPTIKQPKRREKLMEQADLARISRDLVRLRDDVPVEVPIGDFAVRDPDPDMLLDFLREQAFRSLVTKVESQGVHAHARVDGGAVASPAGEQKKKTASKTETSKDTPSAPVRRPGKKAVYELVQDTKALRAWVDAAQSAGVVAVDTETTSLDAMSAQLVGISLAVPGDAVRACYIPLAHKGEGAAASQGAFDLGDAEEAAADAPPQVAMKDALAILGPLLVDDSVLKIGQNIKYDQQVLANVGLAVAPIDDTMLLSYVLEGGLHGHGMDDQANLYLGRQTIKFKDVVGTGKSQITFDRVPLDRALEYAAEDAEITLALHQALKPRLVREHMTTVYETMERPLVSVLQAMERHGVKVDATELKRLSDDFAKRMHEFESEIYKLAGREFNIASPKQLGEVLFDELSLEGGKKGKTGAYGTGADVLEKLAAEGHDLPARVLDWRQLAKLKSTYTDALIAQINTDSGRVHTSYSMAATSTGRLASSDPNLQNIPIRSDEGRKIRRAFIAEKGFKLLSADYSQIELRLLAHVAGIDTLKTAFADGEDIHALTASQVFDVPIEGMDPMVRRRAKAINFGIIYGISAFGLARQLDISNAQAQQYIQTYFERYPGIRDYMDRTKAQAAQDGFVMTPFGRKCHVQGINDKNGARRSFAERAAINAPLQGGAADIIKLAMVRMPAALADAGLSARMLLQVHDELIFEVPEKELDATKILVCKVMEKAAALDVPLVVDVGIGDNWGEAH